MSTTRHSERRHRFMPRAAVAVAGAVFLSLAGTGVSYALWTATTSVSGSVSTGTVTVGLTARGLDAMSFGNDLAPVTGSVTVKNTSRAAGAATVSVTSTDALASGFGVWIWPVSDTSTCATTAGPTSSSGTWSSASVTGTLAAGASAAYCVRTAPVDRASVAATSGTVTVAARITAKLAVHSWTATATQPAAMRTDRIYSAVTTAVGDTFTNGGQCVAVTDDTVAGTTPCVGTITPANGIQVQGPVSVAGEYQLVSPDGQCLLVDVGLIDTKPCSGDPAQLFIEEPAPALTVVPPVVTP